MKLKTNVFWNPIVRYYILNSLKLSITGFMVFKVSDSGPGDYFIAILMLVILNAMPIIFGIVLKQNKETLAKEDTKKTIGAIYAGKNVEQKAYLFPMSFMWRRTVFVASTVFLFSWPSLQMIVHHVITLLTLVFLAASGRKAFDSTDQWIIEVGSELLMHFTSIMLAQFTVQSYDNEQREMLEVFTLIFFSCLIILNVVFMIYVAIMDCKEKRRLKAIEAKKKLYEVTLKERTDKKKKKKLEQPVAPVAPLAAIEEKDEEEEGGSSRISYRSENLIALDPQGGCGASSGIQKIQIGVINPS